MAELPIPTDARTEPPRVPRRTSQLNRGLILFLLGAVVANVVYHADLVGRVAYAFERGKLQADREHLSRIDQEDVASLEKLSHAFSLISEVVKPSVVNIQAVSENSAVNRHLREMFGEDNYQPMPSTGTGSGIIVDVDGYIVTNNHVVEESDAIWVTLHDGRKYRARPIGSDPKTDLAVIKIDTERLHPATFGDSDAMEVGYFVLAIGSPFRLGHSVSHGIISATGRSDVGVDIDYQNWLQTDAPINPGNSGGPLINTRGQVIGISVAIATESGGNQGVGFAIPSNVVRRIATTLKEGRSVVRGYLGVEIKPVTPAVATAYDLGEPAGVFVNDVGAGTPARNGGLRSEDIILEINGRPVATRERLQQTVAATEPGAALDMTVWRKRERISLTITVGAQPRGFSTRGSIQSDDPSEPREESTTPDGKGEVEPTARRSPADWLGFRTESVSAPLIRKYKLSGTPKSGAVVTHVDPTSDAYLAELRVGQVIVRANDKKIESAEDLDAVLTNKALEKGVRLKLRWGGETLYTVLQVR